jgi:hypothetical protein
LTIQSVANQKETPVASEINRSVMALATGVLLVGTMAAIPARAQESFQPQNVNDCTFLKDPTKVRQCVESFQGSVQTPDTAPQSPTPLELTPPAPEPIAPTQPPPQAPPPRLAPQ